MASPHQQKLKIDGPMVITGNSLAHGQPLYRDAAGGWTGSLTQAATSADATIIQSWLEAAKRDYRTIVSPYAARVTETDDGSLLAISVREIIRSSGGPSFAYLTAAE
jgi:hypothetical protein